MSLGKYVVGNWKMNGTLADLDEVKAIDAAAAGHASVDVAIAPPATLIRSARDTVSHIGIGAQDVHANASGAHTGNLSAAMIAEAGAGFAIVGHSERRADQAESDAEVAAKAAALSAAGIDAILCVGEPLAIRDSGGAVEHVVAQLKASLDGEIVPGTLTVAYEPIWAIGTGRIPEIADIDAMHRALREALLDRFGSEGANVRLLYGGSVNPGNAAAIFAVPDVNGALVGGASLKAKTFVPIIEAAA